MIYEKFINWKPSSDSETLVRLAERIIDKYHSDGYVLTLRQLYYQFVARDWIPNTIRSYKNLGNVISKARLAGLLPWDAIEDRNREFKAYWTEEDELVPIKELPDWIRFDRWARQPYYVEVWVEKEALGNVINRACEPYFVPHMACKGYLSQSEAWRAGRRFRHALDRGQTPLMIHLGDHDPSGLDMTRDNEERLSLFAETFDGVEVRRIALNRDQIDEYAPPPNPTKITDSRAAEYIARHGRTSWELDALEPQVIHDLVSAEIRGVIDFDRWEETEAEEAETKGRLEQVADRWDEISEFLERE